MYSSELLKSNIKHWTLFFLCLICSIDVGSLNFSFLWSFLIMTSCILIPWTNGERESQERSRTWQSSVVCQLLSLYTCATLIYHPKPLAKFRKYLHLFHFFIAIRKKRSYLFVNWFQKLWRSSNLTILVHSGQYVLYIGIQGHWLN